MLKPGVDWFDDWYAVENIAPGVHAIGEPRYHQLNWNYLIAGKVRALLFDTGPGVRSITPVVSSLTDLPVTAMPSHLHFDHTGNLHRFPDLAMADLPMLRECVRDGVFHAPEHLYLGSYEDMTWKPVRITQWWPVGREIDLGGRRLEIIHTPGHSPDSVSLYDRVGGLLFAADFVYPGELYAQVPGASLPDYLTGARNLRSGLNGNPILLCAHGKPDAEDLHGAPILAVDDLDDLVQVLDSIRGGLPPTAREPDRYTVNGRIELLAGPEAYGDWR